jgi:uncharacterized protein YjiK
MGNKGTGAGGAVLIAVGLVPGLALTSALSSARADMDPAPRLVASYKIADKSSGLSEASGLTLAPDALGLLTVDDESGRIVRLGQDGEPGSDGMITQGLGDLEGIATRRDGTLLLIGEREATIWEFDPATGALLGHPLAGMAGFDMIRAAFAAGDANDGLEGITVDPARGSVFLLRERRPRLLIELSPDLGAIIGVRELTPDMGFVSDKADDHDLDVSGVAWDSGRDGFWIVSDAGKVLFFLAADHFQAQSWKLSADNGRIESAEGIALSEDGTRLWLVTDAGNHSRLYEFALSDPRPIEGQTTE